LPDYLEETVAGAMDLLDKVLLPQVLGQTFAHPESLARLLAPWRANHMAKATVEMAFWDLWAKVAEPAAADRAGRRGRRHRRRRLAGHRPGCGTLDRVARIWRRATSASS
jgi:O-succinylbenzoate synthase